MWKFFKHFYQTYSNRTLFILAGFILFWPFGLYLLWKHRKLGVKTRGAVTILFILFTIGFGFIGYNAPPYISLADSSVTNNYKTDNDYVEIRGSVSTLHSAEVLINGKVVAISETGDFNYKLSLSEGDTNVSIISRSEKGTDQKEFRVHRTTTSEFAERKRIAEANAKKIAEEKKVAEAEAKDRAEKARIAAFKALPTCDGTNVTSSCKVDDIAYKSYVYHAAVPAKTHKSIVTTYRQEISGYCTLCGDGSYSPSCATGSGACSHHSGVAQWNAPRYRNVPVYTENTIVDAPATEAYYEKVAQ